MTATARRRSNLKTKLVYSETSATETSLVHPVAGNQNKSPTLFSQRQDQYPVKREQHTPTADILPAPDSDPVAETVYGWNHPAELEYITPEDWSSSKIISHLIANAFSVPPRAAPKSGASIVVITSINGQQTALPIGYRIPLMFLARFQWLSLKLVLTAASRETEWSEYKFNILHVCRICNALLKAAQEYVRVANDDDGISRGMDRKWRCPTFDRALARYRLRWLMSNPSQVQEFWEIHREEEYKKDVLKFDWRRWSLKGHRGFALTEDEIVIGIKAEQLMYGLKQKNGEWFWETEDCQIVNGIDAWSFRASAMDAFFAQPIPFLPFPSVDPVMPSSQLSAPKKHNDLSLFVPSIKLPAMTSSSANAISLETPQRHHSNSPSSSREAAIVHVDGDASFSSIDNSVSTSLPSKTIPQKRPGSPLQNPRVRMSGARSSSTPLENGTRSSGKRLDSLPRSGNAKLPFTIQPPSLPSVIRPELSSTVSRIQPQTISIPDFPSYLPPVEPYNSFSGVPSLAPMHPPPQPISTTESLSSETLARVIDGIFSGFAESLHKFSAELKQSKTETVAEVRESLISTFSGETNASGRAKQKPELGESLRKVVREEAEQALGEKLTYLRNDIVGGNQREVRDGVRIAVAAMREELVEGIQEEFGSAIGQLQDENARIIQQLQSQSHGISSRSVATSTNWRRGPLAQESPETPPSITRVSHPLQNLLAAAQHNPRSDLSHFVDGNDNILDLAGNPSQETVCDAEISSEDILPIKSRRKFSSPSFTKSYDS